MNYIVYDLEATCWEGRPPNMEQETIEIGAIRINGYGEVTGSYNRFIKPVLHPYLSHFCKDLTSIDQVAINRAKLFPDVIDEFKDWIGVEEEEYLLCAWGSFDKKQLVRDCILHRQDDDWLEDYINLKAQYQSMKGLRHPCGLRKAVEREGYDFTGVHHRGIYDAQNLAKLFLRFFGEWQR